MKQKRHRHLNDKLLALSLLYKISTCQAGISLGLLPQSLYVNTSFSSVYWTVLVIDKFWDCLHCNRRFQGLLTLQLVKASFLPFKHSYETLIAYSRIKLHDYRWEWFIFSFMCVSCVFMYNVCLLMCNDHIYYNYSKFIFFCFVSFCDQNYLIFSL